MNPKYTTPENSAQFEENDAPSLDNTPSLDDFIKELEAKEKDLQLSSDVLIEIDETGIESVNSFELLAFLDACKEQDDGEPDASQLFLESPNNYGGSELGRQTAELRGRVAKLEAERLQLAETMRRRQTDFDNYRKRSDRDRSETFNHIVGNVAIQLLPVVDNLSRALDSTAAFAGSRAADFEQFFSGIELVSQQLTEVLAEMGVEPIPAVGKIFDPHLHEAATTEESAEFPPNTIIAELLRGYRIGERVIRHSLVKVSAANSAKNTFAEIE